MGAPVDDRHEPWNQRIVSEITTFFCWPHLFLKIRINEKGGCMVRTKKTSYEHKLRSTKQMSKQKTCYFPLNPGCVVNRDPGSL